MAICGWTKIARDYRGYGLPISEAISEGNVGLMQAVERFEPEKGFRLATYATWWIKAAIQEYILRSWSLVKMGTTANQKKLFFNLRKAQSKISILDDGDMRLDQVKIIARRGFPGDAEIENKSALRLSPQFAPAAINLADLYRQLGHESEGESVLRTAIEASPRDAGLHHALGLTLTRLKRTDEAIAELRRAAELEPDRARYAYVYAVALHSAGRGEEAIAVLKDSLARHPEDRDILLALITFNRDAGDLPTALEYAERLARAAPNDREVANLVQNLHKQIERSAQ